MQPNMYFKKIKTNLSNQSILKEISPGCSLEGLMLKLKLQYFGHLIRRADSFEKTLMVEKIESRRRGQRRMRWLDGITNSMTWVWVSSRSWWWTERPGVLWFMESQRVGHDWATELNWKGWGGGGNDNPLQYFCLENPIDRAAWWTTVHGVSKSRRTWLSN